MDASIPDKAYFRIGEVSKLLGLEPYVIRYWESEFKSIRPERTKSDQRLYRRKDVVELQLIKTLLYEDQFTILGAKKQLVKIKTRGEDHGIPDRLRLAVIKEGLEQIRNLVS
jgi:DNA-binding transcriptional MerR regulator